MPTFEEILDNIYNEANAHLTSPFIEGSNISEALKIVCLNPQNRACIRLLISCLLAKVHDNRRGCPFHS